MIKVGNRYKVRYDDWVSDYTYEVISNAGKTTYYIGIDRKYMSFRDRRKIPGWYDKELEEESGMRYNLFWCVDEDWLINKNMEIE